VQVTEMVRIDNIPAALSLWSLLARHWEQLVGAGWSSRSPSWDYGRGMDQVCRPGLLNQGCGFVSKEALHNLYSWLPWAPSVCPHRVSPQGIQGATENPRAMVVTGPRVRLQEEANQQRQWLYEGCTPFMRGKNQVRPLPTGGYWAPRWKAGAPRNPQTHFRTTACGTFLFMNQ
jgi:hypothetical protein